MLRVSCQCPIQLSESVVQVSYGGVAAEQGDHNDATVIMICRHVNL
jgi:hypothetical protein